MKKKQQEWRTFQILTDNQPPARLELREKFQPQEDKNYPVRAFAQPMLERDVEIEAGRGLLRENDQ